MRIVTDGGAKAAGYKKQFHDCAVVALSIAMGLLYDQAYKKLEAAGFRKDKGFFIIQFMEHCTFKGYEVKELKFKKKNRPTVFEFAAKHKRGNWVLYTEGHVLAVVNGIIFDTVTKPFKAKVRYAWRITKTS